MADIGGQFRGRRVAPRLVFFKRLGRNGFDVPTISSGSARCYSRIFRQGFGSLRRSFDRVQQEINAWVDQTKMVA
jgi:hypothetical protein